MLRSVPSILAACGHCAKISSCGIRSQLQRRSFYKTSCMLFSASDKNLPVSNQPIPVQKLYQQDTDLLYDELKKAKGIPRLLELVSQHLEVMNNRHIVACFDVINDSAKAKRHLGKTDEVLSTLPDNEKFQALCNHTLDRIRYMEPAGVLTVFKTLTALGIRNNTYIMQALLKMICSQVNELSLTELTFLNFLLSRQKSNPAVDGLKMALPLVLQVQVESQLDSDNVHEVVNCLKLCSQARMKPATIQKIISVLIKKMNVLSGDQAVSVIFSLLNLETPLDGYLELLNNVFHIATDSIEQLQVNQILHVTRMCSKYNFFHSGFLLAAAKKAAEDRWSLEDCMELQKYLHKLCVFHQELLDLLCEHVISNAEMVKTDTNFSLLHIASDFALTNYQAPGLEKLVHILCTAEEKLSFMYEKLPHFYTRFVSSLATLGYFPERILQHVLNESFLMRAWSFGRKSGRATEFEKSVCVLSWSIEAYGQSSHFKVPSTVMKKVTQSVISRHIQSDEFPLTKFLENGIGGPQFFCTGIFSRSGHVIDHVIAMRNGNYPVSLSSMNSGLSGAGTFKQATYIEDLRIPNDAKVITICLANKDSYCREPSGLLRGWEKIKCESLRKMNYFPIMVNHSEWCLLPDREKIPYLMREIKQAVESEDLSRTNLP